MNIEEILREVASENFTDEQLKEIRNAANRELSKRSRVGKVYCDPHNPHRPRTLCFMDFDTMKEFRREYFKKHITNAQHEQYPHLNPTEPIVYTRAQYNSGVLRELNFGRPEDWVAEITINLDAKTFKEIRERYEVVRPRLIRYRKDGSKFNAAQDGYYIVKEKA